MRTVLSLVVAALVAGGCVGAAAGGDGLTRQPVGIYKAAPSEVLGAPDGWVYTRTERDATGGWIERHGYGRTPQEAARNAGEAGAD